MFWTGKWPRTDFVFPLQPNLAIFSEICTSIRPLCPVLSPSPTPTLHLPTPLDDPLLLPTPPSSKTLTLSSSSSTAVPSVCTIPHVP